MLESDGRWFDGGAAMRQYRGRNWLDYVTNRWSEVVVDEGFEISDCCDNDTFAESKYWGIINILRVFFLNSHINS